MHWTLRYKKGCKRIAGCIAKKYAPRGKGLRQRALKPAHSLIILGGARTRHAAAAAREAAGTLAARASADQSLRPLLTRPAPAVLLLQER